MAEEYWAPLSGYLPLFVKMGVVIDDTTAHSRPRIFPVGEGSCPARRPANAILPKAGTTGVFVLGGFDEVVEIESPKVKVSI